MRTGGRAWAYSGAWALPSIACPQRSALAMNGRSSSLDPNRGERLWIPRGRRRSRSAYVYGAAPALAFASVISLVRRTDCVATAVARRYLLPRDPSLNGLACDMNGAARDQAIQLLGRERECAVIDGLLADASNGASGALVVRGEAGIGKSALLEYARRQAAKGMLVLT